MPRSLGNHTGPVHEVKVYERQIEPLQAQVQAGEGLLVTVVGAPVLGGQEHFGAGHWSGSGIQRFAYVTLRLIAPKPHRVKRSIGVQANQKTQL